MVSTEPVGGTKWPTREPDRFSLELLDAYPAQLGAVFGGRALVEFVDDVLPCPGDNRRFRRGSEPVGYADTKKQVAFDCRHHNRVSIGTPVGDLIIVVIEVGCTRQAPNYGHPAQGPFLEKVVDFVASGGL